MCVCLQLICCDGFVNCEMKFFSSNAHAPKHKERISCANLVDSIQWITSFTSCSHIKLSRTFISAVVCTFHSIVVVLSSTHHIQRFATRYLCVCVCVLCWCFLFSGISLKFSCWFLLFHLALGCVLTIFFLLLFLTGHWIQFIIHDIWLLFVVSFFEK